MQKFTKTFKQLTKKDVNIAGGKGASLGEMTKFGFHVPPGFVILAPAFDYFLEKGDILADIEAQLKKIDYDDINSVDRYSNVIRDVIADTHISKDLEKTIVDSFKKLTKPHPDSLLRKERGVGSSPLRRGRLGGGLVAVRSSATAEDSDIASWAGELESYLNTTEKTLLANIKKCWSSLFTPRAIFYRKEKKLHDSHVSVAVVVQEMVESEISGITFTVHPVTQDKNQMIIEAGWGLGESIVSGAITPDSYVINKKDFLIIDINISKQERKIVRDLKKGTKWTSVPKPDQEKQILDGSRIVELAKICSSIEKHYKKPQDIEWAYRAGKFYITQSRPITTL
ncbi:hypothetical protein COV49_02825 [Candidatus Falkowbacteria bacterium CG11_big_fil_rev_8_21_14_0_20_39_10]|uniref:Phosphoenolpyruvate synthase n=1 Tax=Candidatus Falkowbacteria bacterium CG11_big_fil_rev_8_21_14_0_20_39_10 TaxID=1974570 RepID=A0A2M6K8V6_9BACT|nr:MAG: hypothetical protein COV49_02825 [Candidatus Falkowbacteria bacterium CG11_big_fil_rev_8_21_14_0_20_39_10]